MKNIFKNLKKRITDNINYINLSNLSLALNFSNSVKDFFRMFKKHYHCEIFLRNQYKFFFFRLFFISIKSRKICFTKKLRVNKIFKEKSSKFLNKRIIALKGSFLKNIKWLLLRKSKSKLLENIYFKYIKVIKI
jgi:hypothetical protein